MARGYSLFKVQSFPLIRSLQGRQAGSGKKIYVEERRFQVIKTAKYFLCFTQTISRCGLDSLLRSVPAEAD